MWNILAAQPEPRSGGIPVHPHSVGLCVSAGILPELNSVPLGFRFQGVGGDFDFTLVSSTEDACFLVSRSLHHGSLLSEETPSLIEGSSG